MKHTIIALFSATASLFTPHFCIAKAAELPTFAYNAMTDFPSIDGGAVPYYKDEDRQALAINAAKLEYRNQFARATRAFEGPTGTYNVSITTMTEEDGESLYCFWVNNVIAGTHRNQHIGARSPLDLTPSKHTWFGIPLQQGDTLSIESVAHTNREIAEGSGTAWARGRWQTLEITPLAYIENPVPAAAVKALVNPPAGRLAIVNDGNSPDPDDIAAIPVMFGLLANPNLADRLVHLSTSCDLDPFRNGGVQRIDVPNELRRQKKLYDLCDEGIELYGPFPNLRAHYNCRTHQTEAIADLVDAINASSAADPLWIIEAGEPDLIGYALEAADPSKIKHVHVVSHHPANDHSGDYFTWEQILAFGVTEHQIGDQNVELQTKPHLWDWANNHPDPAIAWIWENFDYVERDTVVDFQDNKFDCSDAGMVYWWITGADNGGSKLSTPADMQALLLLLRSAE